MKFTLRIHRSRLKRLRRIALGLAAAAIAASAVPTVLAHDYPRRLDLADLSTSTDNGPQPTAGRTPFGSRGYLVARPGLDPAVGSSTGNDVAWSDAGVGIGIGAGASLALAGIGLALARRSRTALEA
jgi:hypothetical protein